ncbi:MAG: Na/Pi cotransporter family protein [Prevotellaceae bacterium]|nr:Na/Pi cotransporter family protein [Prevotellaceae bacterium]
MDMTTIFTLLGSLALLMFGMKTLSEGLQKMAGSQLRNVLQKMTANRFMGAFTGMFVTASIQSSTATTLMTVSFVNAGLLTLAQAISIILGAHVGTTVTAWIMSLGMTFEIGAVAYMAAFVGIIMTYMKQHKNLGEFLFGMAFLFLGLGTLLKTGMAMELDKNPDVIAFFQTFDPQSIWTIAVFLLIGTVLTLCVQSSAAIMAITMTLCSIGVLPIELGIILVLGENIGTTITSNIAALNANVSARRTAFSHMFINVVGVFWVLCVLHPFFTMVCHMVGCDVDMLSTNVDYAKTNGSVVLAAFHSAFNVANTFLMIWFVPQIEKIVCKVIKPKVEAEDEEARLSFITMGLMQTPELSILNAKQEIVVFGERCQRMYGLVQELMQTEKGENFNKIFSRIEKYEGITDKMEMEIAGYLNQVSEGRLSLESKTEVQRMLRVVSEMESIGDSCYNLARTISRKRQHSATDFTEKQYEHIQNMMVLNEEALIQMNIVVKYGEQRYVDLNKSYNLEHEINNYRTQLKNQNIIDINAHLYDYQMGVYYMDIIAECEKLGDYVINVIESTGIKEKKATGF